MNCPYCGAPIPDRSVFCPGCGRSVSMQVPYAPAQQPVPFPPPPSPSYDKKTLKKIQRERMKADKASRPRKKHGCLVAFLILLLIPVCLLVWMGTRIFRPNSAIQGNPSAPNTVILPEEALAGEGSSPLRDALPKNLSLKDETIRFIDQEQSFGYVDHQVLVTFRPGVSDMEVEQAAAFVGGTVSSCVSNMNLFSIRVPVSGQEELENVCARLMGLSCVRRAFIDRVSPSSALYVDYALDEVVPNDPWAPPAAKHTESWSMLFPRGRNWALERTGVPSTWAYQEYCQREADGRPIRVGIADVGFSTLHIDLTVRMVNPQDNSPGEHGTFVAGIIGAARGNGTGISGAAIECTMLGASLVSNTVSERQVDTARILQVFGELLDNGCRIINFSFGNQWTSFPSDDASMQALRENLTEEGSLLLTALTEQYGSGFLLVAAAGNSACDAALTGYICSATREGIQQVLDAANPCQLDAQAILDRVIVVANSTSSDKLAFDSCFGSRVDLAAPGENVYSTTYKDGSNTYDFGRGTSFAAPLVTAVAASVWSMDLTLSPAQVKRILLETADPCIKTNKAENNGAVYPLLNAKAAVEKVLLDSGTITEGRPDGDWKALLLQFAERDYENKRSANNEKMEELTRQMAEKLERSDYAGYFADGFHVWLLMFKDLWYQILHLIYLLFLSGGS